MSVALYEFPLSEKVRNYLRLEQLFKQLEQLEDPKCEYQHLHFFDVLFTLSDLLERLDLRADFLRDLDAHEKSLVQWSSHPNIDTDALNAALQNIHRIINDLKKTNKLGSSLKEDRFLSSIKQRFSIPGGATSFDLPHLFAWIRQSHDSSQNDRHQWLAQLALVKDTITMLLSFLRERGNYVSINGENGFYQGIVEDKTDLIRVKCASDEGYYPVLSGNKYRYGIKFMALRPEAGSTGAITNTISFQLSCC